MHDDYEDLMLARALAHAQRELAAYWRTSDGVVDGQIVAKLEQAVAVAREHVDLLKSRIEASFGGV